jgi:hypothetical protein
MNLLNEFKYQNYEREYITKNNKSIKNQLKAIAKTVCYNEIPQKYIKNSIKNYDYGYVYRDITNNDKIVSFVLWNIKKQQHNMDKELYIRIICGKGFGKIMFNDVEEYAYQNKINIITLAPINEKVKEHYIMKYGFKIRGYDKVIQSDILYKEINNNIIHINMSKIKYNIKNKKKKSYIQVKKKKY